MARTATRTKRKTKRKKAAAPAKPKAVEEAPAPENKVYGTTTFTQLAGTRYTQPHTRTNSPSGETRNDPALPPSRSLAHQPGPYGRNSPPADNA